MHSWSTCHHTYAHNYVALIVFEHTYMIDRSLMGGLALKACVYPNRFIAFLSGHKIMLYS